MIWERRASKPSPQQARWLLHKQQMEEAAAAALKSNTSSTPTSTSATTNKSSIDSSSIQREGSTNIPDAVIRDYLLRTGQRDQYKEWFVLQDKKKATKQRRMNIVGFMLWGGIMLGMMSALASSRFTVEKSKRQLQEVRNLVFAYQASNARVAKQLESFENSNASTIAAVTGSTPSPTAATAVTATATTSSPLLGGTPSVSSSVSSPSVVALVESVRSNVQHNEQLNQQYSDFLMGLLHKDDSDDDERLVVAPSSSTAAAARQQQPAGRNRYV